MSIGYCILLVAACGAAGGLVACFHKEQLLGPKIDKAKRIFNPGAIGNVVIGSFAAVVVWALYSSNPTFIFGSDSAQKCYVTLYQFGSSLMVGFSGGKILALMAQKHTEHIANDELSKTLKETLEKLDKKR